MNKETTTKNVTGMYTGMKVLARGECYTNRDELYCIV